MEKLDLPTDLLMCLRKAKLTDPTSIVQLSQHEITRLTGLASEDVSKIIETVAKSILLSKPLTNGCSILDKFLRGGLMSQGITEIAGESAAGKTQLCMQLSLTVQLPEEMGGLGGGAMYICTEDAFPNKRLMEMVRLLQRRSANRVISHHPFSDNIYVEHTAEIESIDDLKFCVFKKAQVLLEKKSVKLIIVDSLAALFRGEFGSGEMKKRAKVLSEFGTVLKGFSTKHNIPVICVNQVSDVINDNNQPKDSRQMKPALGLSWSHFVTTRLMLTRSQQYLVSKNTSDSRHEINIRQMEVLFAPHLPNVMCRYIIDQEGVKGMG